MKLGLQSKGAATPTTLPDAGPSSPSATTRHQSVRSAHTNHETGVAPVAAQVGAGETSPGTARATTAVTAAPREAGLPRTSSAVGNAQTGEDTFTSSGGELTMRTPTGSSAQQVEGEHPQNNPASSSLSPAPGCGVTGYPAPALGCLSDQTQIVVAHESPGAGELIATPKRRSNRGRPSVLARYGLDAAAVMTLQRLYLSVNRTADTGSYVEAVRLFCAQPACPPEFRDWFAKQQRRDPHGLPPSLREAMAPVKPQVAWARAPRRAELDRGLHGHGRLRYHESENRRLYAGEVEVWDDGSVNFVCWVPWPWGGCRVSDKWGCKVGRFQLLAALDAASSFCPGFSFVARPSQSYRAEDITASMVRLWLELGRPDKALLEKGSWESRRVAALIAAAGMDVRHTYTPRHKLIEPWFGRVWLRTSSEERVSLGRYRRDDEAGSALHERLKSGSIDPRLHCQSLPEFVAVVEKAVIRSNSEPIHSKVYGSWIPAERWAEDLKVHGPRKPLGRDLAWTHAPEIREWTVRKSHVWGVVEHPLLGVKVDYAFSWPEAWRCEGKRVRVHFDPAADLCRAAIVAIDNIPEAGLRAGDLITDNAESISDNATILPGGEIDWDGGAEERTRRMLAAQRHARAVEFRALQPDGKRAAWSSEIRGPDGKTTGIRVGAQDGSAAQSAPTPVEVSAPARTAAPAVVNRGSRILTDAEEAAELARLAAKERALQQAGIIPLEVSFL